MHASDRKLDLAIVKIDAKEKLKPLPLGDSSKLKQGQAIVALGHPRGPEVQRRRRRLSGKREIDGVSMLQLAIPIEQGNSGGPVLDMQGRVVGIVTMKSLVTDNLGFAVPVNALKQIHRPSPIPITDGALAHHRRTRQDRMEDAVRRPLAATRRPHHRRRRRHGFGGRTLCLSQRKPPEFPYEVTVTVKLDDEAGAAGLIFGGDGGDKHYGFYPTGGKLRLTRFDGPDVFSWKILHDQTIARLSRPATGTPSRSASRRTGSSATSTTKRSPNSTIPTITARRSAWPSSARRSRSSRSSRSATEGRDAMPIEARRIARRSRRSLADDSARQGSDAEGPRAAAEVARRAVNALARQGARSSKAGRAVAQARGQTVHHERTLAELAELFKAPRRKVDLALAALLVAKLDNEELDIDVYRQEIDRLARARRRTFAKDAEAAGDARRRSTSSSSRSAAFTAAMPIITRRPNSYLNEVIDDREGLADHAVGAVHGDRPAAQVERRRRASAGPFRRAPRTDRRARRRSSTCLPAS